MKKHLLLSVCVAAATLQTMGQANTNLSNLTAPTAVNVPLLPQGDNIRNIGSAAKSWKDVFVDGKSYLFTSYSYFDQATNQYRINNAGDRLVINNAGNIGIGTLAPAASLDIQTTGLSPVLMVKKPWTGSGTTNFNLVEINNAYTFGYGTGLYASGGYTGVKGYTANGGNTGYGVYGESFGAGGSSYGVYGTASSASTAIGVRGVANSSGANAYGVYGSASGTSAWGGYFLGRGYFSGNLGVGTSSPDVKLQVVGGTDASPSSGGYIVSGSTTSSNIVMDDNEIMARNNGVTSPLYLNNSGGDVVLCTSSGNVMIGTSTPAAGYILSVDGKVMAEEVRVQLSGDWPDYVFSEKYELPSLKTLEVSVKNDKHLPGIPTAEEVKKDGITVGKMQTKMMEKIEELTLYIISLQKQIDELKKAQH